MEEDVSEQIAKKIVNRRTRRLVAGALALLLVLPLLLIPFQERAWAIYFSALEAQGGEINFYHEGFEYIIVMMYAGFSLFGLAWSATIFFGQGIWPRSRLLWQVLAILFVWGIPAMLLMALLLESWPPALETLD